MDAIPDRRAILLLVLVCVPLFFVGLGGYDLDGKGEPREANTAREMVRTGEWVLPRLNGELLPEKPLVFPWLVAVSSLVLGDGNEFAVRLPSALLGTGAVLLVFALGRLLLGTAGGLASALVFATTALVVSLARRARVDMTLTFFVCLACWLFLREYLRWRADPAAPPRRGPLAMLWIALALGTLTKGPLGALLPGLAIGPFLLARGHLRFLARLGLPWGMPLYVAVAGSWYAAGILRAGEEFGHRSFLMENFKMFLQP